MAEPLTRFLGEAGALGEKLGPILVQLPPSLAFKADLAGFFLDLRARFEGDIACEPRHRSWFTDEVDHLLAELRIARVAADPAVVPRAAEPGGWPGLRYYRLHGSPRMYYSAYPPEVLDALAQRLAGDDGAAWCIFDNTAEGAATHDAMTLADILSRADSGGGEERPHILPIPARQHRHIEDRTGRTRDHTKAMAPQLRNQQVELPRERYPVRLGEVRRAVAQVAHEIGKVVPGLPRLTLACLIRRRDLVYPRLHHEPQERGPVHCP